MTVQERDKFPCIRVRSSFQSFWGTVHFTSIRGSRSGRLDNLDVRQPGGQAAVIIIRPHEVSHAVVPNGYGVEDELLRKEDA